MLIIIQIHPSIKKIKNPTIAYLQHFNYQFIYDLNLMIHFIVIQ